MDFSQKQDLPPMNYFLGQEVNFNFNGKLLCGQIKIVDFGGSLEQDCHSYDIYVEKNNTLYKHVPEVDIFE